MVDENRKLIKHTVISLKKLLLSEGVVMAGTKMVRAKHFRIYRWKGPNTQTRDYAAGLNRKILKGNLLRYLPS